MSFQSIKGHHLLFACAVGGLLPLPTTLLAQDTAGTGAIENKAPSETEETKTNAKKKKDEHIQVTGSRLKRIDVEGTRPISVLGPEEIEKAGVTTLSELLRNQTENTFGSFRGATGNIADGQATVNLRGLGADRTLVLINGRRLPSEASLGGVNINNIPVEMIERVEVVKMSASAIYGADAVSGVLNVILKKNFTGVATTLSSTTTQQGGGDTQSFSVVGGGNIGNTNVTVSAGGARTDALFSRDRDDLWAYNGNYQYTAYGNPEGTYTWALLDPKNANNTKGAYVYRPSPNCPDGNRIAFSNAPDTVMCRGLRRDVSTAQLISEKKNWFAMANTNTELNNALKINTTAIFAEMETAGAETDRLDTSDPLTGADYKMRLADAPADLQAEVGRLGLATDPNQMIKILSRALPYVKGNSQTRDTMMGGMVGLGGPINGIWDWQVDLSSFGTMRQRYYNNVDDKLMFTQNMFPNDGTTPKINIFNPDPELMTDLFANLYGKERNGISTATAYATGTIGSIPGGDVSLAFGGNFQHETYELIADDKDKEFFGTNPRYWGSMNSDGKGQRDVASAFVELNVPVVKELQLGLAGRLDHYDDFGDTFNYASTIGYAATSWLKFRGNYGTSFKAPSLSMLYNKSDGGYLSVTDKQYCDLAKGDENPCGQDVESYSIYVNNPGNVDLKEETAIAYTAGFILQPVEFFDFTADYWAAKIKGMHNQDDLDDIVERDRNGLPIGRSRITRVDDPSRDDFGKITNIENSYVNLGTTTTSGFDLESNLHENFGPIRTGLRTRYSNIISRKEEISAGQKAEEWVGAYSLPRYRTSNTLSVESSNHHWRLDALTIGRMENSQFDSDPSYGYIKPFTRFDTTYAWDHPWNGTLSVGVFNLENKIGTLHTTDRVYGTVGFSSNNADALGRRFYVAIKQRI